MIKDETVLNIMLNIGYYNKLVKILQEKNMLIEVAYVKLGANLQLRRSELDLLEWSQIDYPYMYNIYSPKYGKIIYDKVELPEDVIEALKMVDNDKKGKLIFEKSSTSKRSVYESIKNLCDQKDVDISFNSVTLYKLGQNGVRECDKIKHPTDDFVDLFIHKSTKKIV